MNKLILSSISSLALLFSINSTAKSVDKEVVLENPSTIIANQADEDVFDYYTEIEFLKMADVDDNLDDAEEYPSEDMGEVPQI